MKKVKFYICPKCKKKRQNFEFWEFKCSSCGYQERQITLDA